MAIPNAGSLLDGGKTGSGSDGCKSKWALILRSENDNFPTHSPTHKMRSLVRFPHTLAVPAFL